MLSTSTRERIARATATIRPSISSGSQAVRPRHLRNSRKTSNTYSVEVDPEHAILSTAASLEGHQAGRSGRAESESAVPQRPAQPGAPTHTCSRLARYHAGAASLRALLGPGRAHHHPPRQPAGATYALLIRTGGDPATRLVCPRRGPAMLTQ